MAKILVTGGLGFIGSHTVIALQEEGYEVVIIDDLSNSTLETLDRITSIHGIEPEYHNIDIKDAKAVNDVLTQNNGIQGIIHFAAHKSVSESVASPLKYYDNNIGGLINLLKGMKQLSSPNFIFSSSCTVYGEAKHLPISENADVQTAKSPYGNTKQIGEEILSDVCSSKENFNCISLRYFNPIGAHPSSKIGELPLGVPQNLVPFITQTAIGLREELKVFGNDYPTSDGTCIRDYIHVVDLAKAHVIALKRLLDGENDMNYEVFNLGTGKGHSVLEVIQSFERISGRKLNYSFAKRRDGDVMAAYADTKKANEVLNWRAELNLDQAMLDAWKWEQQLRSNE